MEYPDDGLRHAEDLARGEELVELVSRPAQDRRASAHRHPEAAAAGAVRPAHPRVPADVVDRRYRVVLGAALEGDLELPRQRRAQGMAQQVTGERLRVGRHVEGLALRDARVGTRGDVAHRVAASLPRGEPGLGEASHRRLHVVELHEVELHVLARGDVAEAAGPALGDVGQRPELRDVQRSLGNLDPDHLRVAGLALPVGPADEAEGAPLVGGQLAALVPVEGGHELVDVGLVGERQAGAAEGTDVGQRRHDGLLNGPRPRPRRRRRPPRCGRGPRRATPRRPRRSCPALRARR